MKKVAIIPLREGSKGIPGKNKKKMLGRPLFTWVLSEAIFSNLDEIYVYTDDDEIIEYVKKEYKWSNKVSVLKRSPESASDTASTEMAMLEFSERINHGYDVLCLLQATSPLTSREDINNSLKKVVEEEYDSSLTVVRTMRFIWNEDGTSINYDYKKRPRRQEFNGLLMENGAVYATTKKQFIDSEVRIGGKIATVEMPEDTLTEIDELEDWIIVEKLLANRVAKSKKGSNKIKAMFFDVDGVFTDGTLANSKNGELTKTFSLRDGMGLEILRNSGVEVFVMTSEDSELVKNRMSKLKIVDNLYLGIKDKYSRIEEILLSKGYKRNEIAYMGDDVNDLANISSVAWGISPNDGAKEVKNIADLILNTFGGNHSIREAIEFIIRYNKKF